MTTTTHATSQLLDAMFHLPPGVHVGSMDRIPMGSGRWQWKMTLTADEGVEIPSGEVILVTHTSTDPDTPDWTTLHPPFPVSTS